MDFCRDCEILLSYILECGSSDLDLLFRQCEDWDIDYTDAVDQVLDRGEKLNFENLLVEVYYQHIENVKDTLKNILEEIENEYISFDYKKLDDYEVNIYFNYRDTSFNNKYSFWEAKDGWEAADVYLDELVEFLIDEGIAEVRCEDCDEYEVLKKEIQEYIGG